MIVEVSVSRNEVEVGDLVRFRGSFRDMECLITLGNDGVYLLDTASGVLVEKYNSIEELVSGGSVVLLVKSNDLLLTTKTEGVPF